MIYLALLNIEAAIFIPLSLSFSSLVVHPPFAPPRLYILLYFALSLFPTSLQMLAHFSRTSSHPRAFSWGFSLNISECSCPRFLDSSTAQTMSHNVLMFLLLCYINSVLYLSSVFVLYCCKRFSSLFAPSIHITFGV